MYKVVIGLEVHCELKTNSKNFSGAQNTYSDQPNSHVAAVDLGLPGIMPVVNEEAVRKALKTAMALNCINPDEVMFDRKNYFYPDLPKGYQITQVTKPMGKKGYLIINVDGEDKRVDITQLHLEEDTASLDHFANYSLIDYNRSGIPLMEVVTEPCMHSAKEAVTFLETLRNLFLYCEVSDARSDKGQMRCDVNISLMKEDSKELGTKVEMKNINSFGNVKAAIEYEIERQTEILTSGGTVLQETRRFDIDDMKSVVMRGKVDAVDYKYYIEPNIPSIKITQEYLEEIRSEIPELQYERINKYINKYELSRYDANVLARDKNISDYFEEIIKEGADPKIASNWMTSIIMGHLNKNELDVKDLFVTPKMLSELIKLVNDKTISIKQGKEVLTNAIMDEKDPISMVKDLGITQIQDDSEIRKIVLEVIEELPDVCKTYREGKLNAIDFLVGKVMKKSKGKANPDMTMKTLKEELDRR